MNHDISNTTRYTKDHLEFSDTDYTFVDEHGDMWTASDCLEEIRGLLDDSGEDPITKLQTIEALVSLDVAEDFDSMEIRSEDRYDPLTFDESSSEARDEHFSTTP